MHCPRYTPVAPSVDTQGEYNIPPVDNENGDHGGADMHPALPGRHVPYQAPPPGDNQNSDPPTLLGSTPPDSGSDNDFYGVQAPPITPPPRSPHGDLDSSHGFFNPYPDSSEWSYAQKKLEYGDLNKPASPTRVCWYYMRGGQQKVYDWENPPYIYNPYGQGPHMGP